MYSQTQLKQLHGQDYVKDFDTNPKQLTRLKKLTNHMRLGSDFDVADFGCGSGMLMSLIAPQVQSYTGVDFSEPFIVSANKRKLISDMTNATFICTDIHTFCQQHSKQFDVGFALDFSEHVYDKEWIQILTSIRSSLKPKGKLYLHTPNADFFIEKMKAQQFILKQIPTHIAVRSLEENIALVKKAGFNVTQLKMLPHYNVLRFLHPISYVPVIGAYFQARIFIEAEVR